MVMAREGKSPNRNTARYNIERQYIVFYDSEFDLSWNESDVVKFQKLWEKGLKIERIAAIFNRHPLEVFVLMIDLAEHEKIERRPTGIYGL